MARFGAVVFPFFRQFGPFPHSFSGHKMATKTTKPETENAAENAIDPLFDVYGAQDDAGKPVAQTDIAALMRLPRVVDLKIGGVTLKTALHIVPVSYETWMADENYRRRFMIEGGAHQGEDLTPEQTLHNIELNQALNQDEERIRLRATLVIAALARSADGVAMTQIPELRDAPTVATLTQPDAYKLWGRRLIDKCCEEIDGFFLL